MKSSVSVHQCISTLFVRKHSVVFIGVVSNEHFLWERLGGKGIRGKEMIYHKKRIPFAVHRPSSCFLASIFVQPSYIAPSTTRTTSYKTFSLV